MLRGGEIDVFADSFFTTEKGRRHRVMDGHMAYFSPSDSQPVVNSSSQKLLYLSLHRLPIINSLCSICGTQIKMCGFLCYDTMINDIRVIFGHLFSYSLPRSSSIPIEKFCRAPSKLVKIPSFYEMCCHLRKFMIVWHCSTSKSSVRRIKVCGELARMTGFGGGRVK